MNHPVRFIVILLIAAAVAVGLVYFNSNGSEVGVMEDSALFGIIDSEEENIGIQVGEVAPDFLLQDFDGEEIRLSDLRGQKVMIDFWASWCGFCAAEMPVLETIHQESDVVVMGIHRSATESVISAQSFAEQRGVTYALLQDPSDEVYLAYTGGRTFMPVAFFVDKDGVIIEKSYGPKTEEQIREIVSK